LTADQLRRTAGRAGLAAAVVGVPADLYHFTMDGRTAAAAADGLGFRLHGVGLVLAFTLVLLALAGLVLAQEGRAGRLGRAGAALALLGGTLVIGDLAKEAWGLPLAPEQLGDPAGYYLAVVVLSFGLLSAGWLLTALALRRAGVLSGPATGLLVAGSVLAFPPIPGAYVTLLVGIAVATAALRRPSPVEARRPVAA
jgi:hypothetical protein